MLYNWAAAIQSEKPLQPDGPAQPWEAVLHLARGVRQQVRKFDGSKSLASTDASHYERPSARALVPRKGVTCVCSTHTLHSAPLTSASSHLDLNTDVTVQVALGLVQGVDEVYQAVTEPGPCQFVVAVGAALYKVRKLTFVTLMGAAEGWLLPIVLAIVVLEGNSFLRSAENALSYAVANPSLRQEHSLPAAVMLLNWIVGHRLGSWLILAAYVACRNYGLPRRRSTWVQLLSWLTRRTYKIIILTCLMLAWERYGTLWVPGCAHRMVERQLQYFLSSVLLRCAPMQCARYVRSHPWRRGH